MVERLLHAQKVRGSNPLPPTRVFFSGVLLAKGAANEIKNNRSPHYPQFILLVQ